MLAGMENITPAQVYVDTAIKQPKDKQPPMPLADISDSALSRARELGVALEGKSLALDHDGVRHAYKEHGGQDEYKRGQEPITVSDIAAWHEVFNIATLRAGLPPKARDGTALIAGTAFLNGWRYDFAAKVRRKDVVLQTLFKRKEK